MPETELTNADKDKIAFDYAWNWFDFHGKQRMQLFNYFLIITGILATAFVTALDKKLYDVGVMVCALGIIQSFVFIIFDVRNRDLTYRAERALRAFERKHMLFEVEPNTDQIEICLPQNETNRFGKMKFWIWTIEGLIGLLFCGGIVYAYKLKYLYWICLSFITIMGTILIPIIIVFVLNNIVLGEKESQ